MFDLPKTTTQYVAPEEPIDVNQRYLVRVTEIIDMGITKYPKTPDDKTRRFQWHFRLGHLDGTPVLDLDGNPFEHYDYTSSKTTKAKTAGGKTATARLWIEALFGRALEDDEITQETSKQVLNKVAVALFEEKGNDGDDNQGQEQSSGIRILRLSPYKKGSAAQAATATRGAAANAAATVAKARTAVTVAEPPADEEAAF